MAKQTAAVKRHTALIRCIRQIMDVQGWNQTEMAEYLGTRQPVISAWLSGDSYPAEGNRRKLANLLGYTIDAFDSMLSGETAPAAGRFRVQTAEELLQVSADLSAAEKKRVALKLFEELMSDDQA